MACAKYLVTGFLLLGCLSILALLSVLVNKTIDYPENKSRDLAHNWEKKPFSDIKIIEKYYNCPYGYRNILENEEWPGTNSGCFCPQSFTPVRDFKYGCDSSCSVIRETYNSNYESWRGQIICAKEYDTTYLDIKRNSKQYCSYGEVQCGKIPGSDLNYCASSSKGCPISDISIIGVNATIPYNKTNYKVVKGTNMKIIYTNQTNNYATIIPTSFVISEETTCENPNVRIINKLYPLLKRVRYGINYTSSCIGYGQGYDYSQKVDTYLTKDFISDNRDIDTKIKDLPQYDLSGSTSLWLKSYIPVYESAVNEILSDYWSSSYFYRLLKESTYMTYDLQGFSIACLVIICLAVIVLLFGLNSKESLKCERIRTMVVLMLLLVTSALSCVVFQLGYYNAVYYIQYKFSTTYLDNLFVNNWFNNLGALVLATLIMPVAFSFFTMILFVNLCCCRKSPSTEIAPSINSESEASQPTYQTPPQASNYYGYYQHPQETQSTQSYQKYEDYNSNIKQHNNENKQGNQVCVDINRF